MNYQPTLYTSPICLPEGKSGTLEVKYREITGEVSVIGARQAFTRGRRPIVAMLSAPRRIHELSETGRGVWMTDLPEELNQIAEMLATVQPHGSVLVGGLGLGILSAALAARSGVGRVVTVEHSEDVIRLCYDPIKPKPNYEIVHGDLLDFLKQDATQVDFYLLDTWQGTNEGAWWDSVFPLRRAIRQHWGVKPQIWCWAEDIMLGQIRRTLLAGNRTWKYKGLPKQMSTAKINSFLHDVGLPKWERQYGHLYQERRST